MKISLLVLALTALPLAAQTADQKIAALEARVAKLEALVAKLTAGNAHAPAAKTNTATIVNRYGIPDAVLEKIKAPIIQRYPDNYSMQKTLIDAQVQDYKELHGIE